jgi:hypothetical protein
VSHWSSKKPSRREVALTLLRVAGYHQDSGEFTRLYIENRVSYAVAKEHYAIGARQRASGVPCGCHECQNKPSIESKQS